MTKVKYMIIIVSALTVLVILSLVIPRLVQPSGAILVQEAENDITVDYDATPEENSSQEHNVEDETVSKETMTTPEEKVDIVEEVTEDDQPLTVDHEETQEVQDVSTEESNEDPLPDQENQVSNNQQNQSVETGQTTDEVDVVVEEATDPVSETTDVSQDTGDWLDEQLEAYEGQIEEVDIEVGLAIIEKLDIEYLNELSTEGLTNEEKAEVKSHLNERLTESEYATALALYREYIGLLQ